MAIIPTLKSISEQQKALQQEEEEEEEGEFDKRRGESC